MPSRQRAGPPGPPGEFEASTHGGPRNGDRVQLRWARATDSARMATLEIRILGTAGKPRVDIDEFVIVSPTP